MSTVHHSRSAHVRVQAAVLEALESRELMSASLIDFGAIAAGGLTSSATDLGSMHVKSKASVKGKVGVTSTDAVYKLNITDSVTLNLKLSKLAQKDQVKILFADGTPVNEGWTNGGSKSLKISQRLDAGTYFVDVSHRYRETSNMVFGSAKVQKYKLKATDGFALSISAANAKSSVIAPVAPVVQTKFSSAFGAVGTVSEPTISAQLAANSSFAGYSDFSGSPLWSANGPSADDIRQGAIGDCYFMSILSSIARTDPGAIENAIVPQANNQYLIKFQINGQEFDQQIDAQLPTNGSGHVIFAQFADSRALWPALLEKAWCFARQNSNDPGSYDGIDGGLPSESLKAFGSTDAQDIGANQFQTAGQMLTQVSSLLQQGQTVDFDTIQPTAGAGENALPSGLFTGHAYSVVSADPNANTITLRNPWATNTQGNPNDGSGGYITIDGDDAMQSVAAFSFGSVPIVQPNVNPTPTPDVPTPTPVPTTTNQIAGELGVHSFVTERNSNYDVYSFTATTSGKAIIVVDTTHFRSQLLLAEAGYNGDLTAIASDSNAQGAQQATIRFTAVAGTTYDIGIFAGGSVDTGAYSLQLSNNLGGVTQVLPETNNPVDAVGSIAGTVYEDDNGNGFRDAREVGSPEWTVYVDLNQDGQQSQGEPAVVTDNSGHYAFGDLESGEYIVRVTPDTGWTQTQPAGNNTGWYATVNGGENTEVNPFGMISM